MSEQGQGGRRQQILEALARELETSPGSRITTARLAEVVGVSEAALYRHFPSKAKMFEALIAFAEDTVFSLVNRIMAEEKDAMRRCEQVMRLLLGFTERNPGITRVLLGDALVGENERLHARVGQFFNRLETHLKQILREGGARDLQAGREFPVGAAAALLMAVAEGKMARFVGSRFELTPGEQWDLQWELLTLGLFGPRS